MRFTTVIISTGGTCADLIRCSAWKVGKTDPESDVWQQAVRRPGHATDELPIYTSCYLND